MKILSKRELKELATKQGFDCVESIVGFIDKDTNEVVVPYGSNTRTKLHELGHERLEHFPKAVKFYGKGKKDIYNLLHPTRQKVDDEIEAEMYSYRLMGKKITPKVGMMALREILEEGWDPYRALSLVIGRLRHYGIETSWQDRVEIVRILERARGEKIKGYECMD